MRWGIAWVLLCACGSVNKAPPDAGKADAAADATPDAETTVVLSSPMGPTDAVDSDGGNAAVSVHVHTAQPNQTANVSFTGALGTYAPALVAVTTDGSGNGSASSTFTAGSMGGTETTSMVAGLGGTESPAVTTMFAIAKVMVDGYETPFSGDGGFGQNYLLGQQISVPTAGNLVKIGFVSQQAGPNIKIGIYTSAGTAPGTLVAQAGPVAIVQGTNEISITPVALAAGTYWYMAIYDTTGHIGADTAGTTGTSTIDYISLPYTSALPATYPTSPSTYPGEHFNYFLVVK